MAFTEQGSIYSWGQGSEGKLGLGFSNKLRSCLNQEYPKKITEGFERMKNKKANDAFKNAGCGMNINVAITLKGQTYTWGKPSFSKYSKDFLETYSRPFILCPKIKISFVNVGRDHALLIDERSHIWSYGHNSKGNLGTGDTRDFLRPSKLPFFANKRVIDVACGDSFSVIIAEVF